jgi:hypothetical protein
MNNLRVWFDGDDNDPVEDLLKKNRPIKSDDFLNQVIKRLEMVLMDEMFLPINKHAHVPPKFILYLNKVDDLCWQNSKRVALEETLSELIYERAVELALPNSLSVSEIKVEVKLDSSLAHPMFQINAVWSDEQEDTNTSSELTVIENSNLGYPPKIPFFYIRLSKSTSKTDYPFFKDKVCIGRNSTNDVVLNGSKISRVQAELKFLGNDSFLLTNLGKNSIKLDSDVVFPQTTISINIGQTLKIYDFNLEICKSKTVYQSNNYYDLYSTTKC